VVQSPSILDPETEKGGITTESRPRLVDLNAYIPGVLTWVYNRLSSNATKSFQRWYGLGITEWRVLAYLGVNREGTAANISRIINLDKAATSRSINSLKLAGLLKTHQMPGRNIRLTITITGQRKFDEMSLLALDREQALLHGFSIGERALLNEMLHRMLANMDLVEQVVPRGKSL
jgi:DNA-binding MarR family transcriptional regulator